MNIRVIEKATHWQIECPASQCIEIPRDGRWTFNGDFENPTFSPSINETRGKAGQTQAEFKADPNPWRNHVFIRDGYIQYLSDCTHELAGMTVQIKPLDDYHLSRYFPDGLPPRR